MYGVRPNLIIGFHGCEASVRDALLKSPNEIKISQKPFDWLGHGLYFWENNYEWALQWAQDKKYRVSEIQIVSRGFFMPGREVDFMDWLEMNKPGNS